MAAGARGIAGLGARVDRMHAFLLCQAGGDLGVAIEALKGGLATGQLVAIGTMRSAIKTLVGASQRAGRDLGGGQRSQKCQA